MTSERKVLADQFQYEGEAEAQKIRSEAERKAAEMLANAEGEATRIKGKAKPRRRSRWRSSSRIPSWPVSLPAQRAGRLAQGTLDSDFRPAHAAV